MYYGMGGQNSSVGKVHGEMSFHQDAHIERATCRWIRKRFVTRRKAEMLFMKVGRTDAIDFNWGKNWIQNHPNDDTSCVKLGEQVRHYMSLNVSLGGGCQYNSKK